jgi:hypothetical protein
MRHPHHWTLIVNMSLSWSALNTQQLFPVSMGQPTWNTLYTKKHSVVQCRVFSPQSICTLKPSSCYWKCGELHSHICFLYRWSSLASHPLWFACIASPPCEERVWRLSAQFPGIVECSHHVVLILRATLDRWDIFCWPIKLAKSWSPAKLARLLNTLWSHVTAAIWLVLHI